MHRFVIALGMLIGLVCGAGAGTWNGASSVAPALKAQPPIELVACTHNDRYCPYGRQWTCRPDGRCWCASCGGGPRYYDEPQVQIPFFGGQFGNQGRNDGRFSPPNKSRFRTWNGCPGGYTVQDGLCKPYSGR